MNENKPTRNAFAIPLAAGLLALPLALALALTLTSPVQARQGGYPGPRHHDSGGLLFRADTDRNREITSAEWQALFAKLDADGNGTLAGDELPGRDARGPYHGRRGHYRGPMPGLLLLKSADADADGQVTRAEWQARLAAVDSDGNGELSHEELVALRPEGAPAPPERPAGAGRGLSLERLSELFDRFDDNDDGVVAADEMPRHPRFGSPDSEN